MDERLFLHPHHLPYPDELQNNHQIFLVRQLPQEDSTSHHADSLLQEPSQRDHRRLLRSHNLPLSRNLLLTLLTSLHPCPFLHNLRRNALPLLKSNKLHHKIHLHRPTNKSDHNLLRPTSFPLRPALLLSHNLSASRKRRLQTLPVQKMLRVIARRTKKIKSRLSVRWKNLHLCKRMNDLFLIISQ